MVNRFEVKSKFEVLVLALTDPSIPIFVPYTSLEEAIKREGRDAKIYDMEKRLIYDGYNGYVNKDR